MKILITGGAGFIGSHIADAYIKAGHEVIIVDNLSTGKKENIAPEARFYEVSISSPEIETILVREKPDIVNHHAAQIDVRKSVNDPPEDARINILGSLNLLEACRKAAVKKIIFASTGGAIYGEQDYFPADTAHKTEPRSPYGIAKLTVEKYLQFYEWTYGISFVALRYANVYGPRQNSHGEAGVVAIFIQKILRGEPLTIYGDGNQTRDYIFVKDVAQCNLMALTPEIRGIFNVGTGVETDVNQLARELIDLSGAKADIMHSPAQPGEQRRSCIQPSKLQKTPFTHLTSGLKETVAWYRQLAMAR